MPTSCSADFAVFFGYFEIECAELRRLLKYNPDQPRVPAGQSGGGQWTSEAGSGASSDLIDSADEAETGPVLQPVASTAINGMVGLGASLETHLGAGIIQRLAKACIRTWGMILQLDRTGIT